MTKQPLVSISIITYNQAEYISQAIEGALMQKTNFDYEILIGEDDSSDGTREICKKYAAKHPDKIRLFLNKRKNVIYVSGYPTGRRNMINNLKNARGKYIAFCEGDDYWTDSYKLQKQVDFLEANPDYGMVYSDYDLLIQKSRKIIKYYNKKKNLKIPTENFFEELLISMYIFTVTVCVKKEYINNSVLNELERHKNWMMSDRPLWIEISRLAKIGYIDESLAVRRRLKESAYQTKNKRKKFNFYKSSYAVRFYYISKYGCSESTKKIVLANYYKMILYYSFLFRDKINAKKAFDNLRRIETDRKGKKLYHYYLSSRNILIWLVIIIFLKVKDGIRQIFIKKGAI